MYNRYIPQDDGTHRRNRVSEPVNNTPPPQSVPPSPPPPSPISTPIRAGDFLKRLLPKNIDTEDLIIIALILLMSADCEEDKNTALITLALYFFL